MDFWDPIPELIRDGVSLSPPEIKLLPGQEQVLQRLREFVNSPEANTFVLKGHAGTGKTTLIRFFVYWLFQQKKPFVLLSSTGRGAKVLEDITGHRAYTVHSLIYVFDGFNQDLDKITQLFEQQRVPEKHLILGFKLRRMEEKNTIVYIIDEASMISDQQDTSTSFARFGSGNLLNDLFTYDPGGKFIFSGDDCQLPPINQNFSPALNSGWLKRKYSRIVWESELTEIVRQEAHNGILATATDLRQLVQNPPEVEWPRIVPLRNRKDISLYDSVDAFVNHYFHLISNRNYTKATLIASTNNECYKFSQLLRDRIFNQPQCALNEDDLLLVTQNNLTTMLMNGDLVKVVKVGKIFYHVNLWFREVVVEGLVSGKRSETLLIESLLTSGRMNLNAHEHMRLFADFNKRMREVGIKQKDPTFEESMRKDPYLNALRTTYGYALTCHKAQGGEWADIFLYMNNKTLGRKPPDFYRWLYTAVSRAKEHLHVPNEWFLR